MSGADGSIDGLDRAERPRVTGAPPDRESLGEALVAAGVLTAELLESTRSQAESEGRALVDVLTERGGVSEADIVIAAATRLGYRYVDLAEYPVDLEAVAIVDEPVARRYQAIPIDWQDGRLVVAMINPADLFAVDDLRIITGHELDLLVTTPSSLDAAFRKYFRLDQQADRLAREAVSPQLGAQAGPTGSQREEEAPVVRLVEVLIGQAVADRASDIHLEPGADDVRIRYRVDGVLHDMKRLPKSMHSSLVSRLKILASLDIAERRVPQDGRVSAVVGRGNADLRVSVLPTVHGEQVTIRILDTEKALLSLDDLGFLPDVAERYRTAYRQPYGTILTTGPTGSGKTTTLYATLNALNDSERKIITVEDPVEYQLPGIAQVQVNPKAGLTFARALRSILRSDPDVILVGEIRDSETASTAIEAALTGHLVLSTLHTQNATSTPARLVEMGVEGHLVGTALDAVVAQRLARRLCERCRQPVAPNEADLLVLSELGGDPPEHIWRPVGCAACARTGFSGRFALHEVMLVSEEIERLIALSGRSDEIREVAVAQGMRTLRTAGIEHAIAGTTSLDEVLRVVV